MDEINVQIVFGILLILCQIKNAFKFAFIISTINMERKNSA